MELFNTDTSIELNNNGHYKQNWIQREYEIFADGYTMAQEEFEARENPPPCNCEKLRELLKEEYIASHIDMIGTPTNSKERHLNHVFYTIIRSCLTDVEIEALQIAKHK